MSSVDDGVRQVADTVLHEGYLLYPYAESALKNQHRYPFGTLYPEAFCVAHDAGDTSSAALECIANGNESTRVSVQARFLQPRRVNHTTQNPEGRSEPSGGVVREVTVPLTALEGLRGLAVPFTVDVLQGKLAVSTEDLGGGHWRISVELRNETVLASAGEKSREQALLASLASAHLLLVIDGGTFISAIDPPDDARLQVEGCKSRGLWPVLVGKPMTATALLAAPIILYDYPELAPESPGDFFDGLEIDELLSLRVLTLTDAEKRVMAEGDPRARQILERTEAAGFERLEGLHGRMRTSSPWTPGTRVRLRPKARADIMDLALEGKTATIQSVERDFEGRTYLTVTVDDDPGKDLGAFGHRFFFHLDEVELP